MDGTPVIVLLVWLASTFAAWIAAALYWTRHMPLVPAEFRATPRWGLAHIVAAVFAIEGLGVLGASIFIAAAPEQDANVLASANVLFAHSIFRLIGVAIMLLILRETCYPDALAQGLSFRRFPYDFALAVWGFLLLTFPVTMVRLALSWFFLPEGTVTEHPLLQALLENKSWQLFAAVALAAVVVAPIAEEFFFRFLLQGWLERLHDFFTRGAHEGDRDWWLAVGQPRLLPPNAQELTEVDLLDENDNTLSVSDGRMFPSIAFPATPEERAEIASIYRPPHAEPIRVNQSPLPMPPGIESSIFTNLRRPWWPIVVSSLLFCAAHFGNGLDPIPLFFLSLGLGFLYRQTGRLLPCILLHAFFNGFTMLMLAFHLFSGKAM